MSLLARRGWRRHLTHKTTKDTRKHVPSCLRQGCLDDCIYSEDTGETQGETTESLKALLETI